jgi:hypothetical protein
MDHPDDDPVPFSHEAEADSEADQKRRRKELKRLADATRPLDSWERYRALVDTTDEAYELIDISNREARFALILMGGLNAVLLVVATRTELANLLSGAQRVWFGTAIVAYVLLAVYFLIQAIELLRPRKFHPHPRPPDQPEGREDFPVGIRYYEDVVMRDVDSHWKAWREVHIGQLNAELAIQLHSLCQVNQAKHVALRRLYAGLRAMTLLLSVSAALFAYLVWL